MMMTASMLRRRTKTRIETLATNISYQLYFIETCICQLNRMYSPNCLSEAKHISTI